MKIAKIETFIIERFLIVRITDENGIQGIGESCYWSYPKATEATILALKDALVGMDSRNINHIWNYLWRYNSSFRSNSISSAISAIDMALWDIKGKRLQAPVWDLLGGMDRKKVRAIAQGINGKTPEEFAEKAKNVQNQGFTALKLTPMPNDWPNYSYSKLIDLSVKIVQAVREKVGSDFDIGIEIHRNMRPHEAIVFCNEVEKYRPYFIEDPIVPDSVLSMSNLSKKVNLPLAVGERNAGVWEFKEYAELVKPGFFKPDVAVAGGITGVKKISDIAEAHHIKICPHNFQGPIATSACIALAVSSPAWDVQESVDEHISPRRDLTDEVIILKDGWYYPSEKPGLGLNFNEESVEKYPFNQANYPPELKDDGSVALS